ncbi:porin, partial [Clostridioides difficile]|nr:porin [Clostridioides difficile]
MHNAQNANGSNASSLVKVGSGNLSGSRWGLRGTEDLGGGLKANCRLENGCNVANGARGQGGRMFGRSAWVGL